MDLIYQNHGNIVLLAGDGKGAAEAAALLSRWGVSYQASVMPPDSASRNQPSYELLILDLTGLDLPNLSGQEVAAVADIADVASTIAIVDLDSLDHIGPFLDADPLEFLSWPIMEDELMAALANAGVTQSFREDVAGLDVGPEGLASLREDAERVARALARLAEADVATRPARTGPRPPSQSARLLRDLIRKRRLRSEFFPDELFADPGWDILLDLAAARHERKQVSVSSLCIAASVPTTTGLRWIKALTRMGLIVRNADPTDGRRSFIAISEPTAAVMERYLDITH
ncbi:winged helix DNA-binding protein [Pacificimonas flava]|uniref:winged helix DNA-binding protein n=1 Tax=Pacificimonas flava TaxID=1234595 RepID=UPI000686C913|nr:winged helix DNA-binding protein [Pacificimonas flava]MBB5279782.1 hypothetical protein [Pacificimonas flava]